jgi:hypothetical protein
MGRPRPGFNANSHRPLNASIRTDVFRATKFRITERLGIQVKGLTSPADSVAKSGTGIG